MAVAAAALAGACEPGAIKVTSGSGSATSVPTLAANERAARLEGQRMLASAVIPASASQLRRAPASLAAGPAVGESSVTSQTDSVGYWKVPMDLAAAFSWLQAHPPRGLTYNGSGSSGGPGGIETEGLVYSAPDGTGWTDAELALTVAPAGTAFVYMRVDGIAQWLDPTPLSDDATGLRLRVTPAGGCPANDRSVVGVTNPGTGLTASLLPPEDPTGALICRYGAVYMLQGHSQPPATLIAHRLVDRATAAKLAKVIAQFQVAHTDGGGSSCPSGSGAADVIAFSYADRDPVDIWSASTGCDYITNGHIMAAGYLGQEIDALKI